MTSSRIRAMVVLLTTLIGTAGVAGCTGDPGDSASAPASGATSGSAAETSVGGATGASAGGGAVDELAASQFGVAITMPVPDGWTSSNDTENSVYVVSSGTPYEGFPASVNLMALPSTAPAASLDDALEQTATALPTLLDGFEMVSEPTTTTLGGQDAAVMEYTWMLDTEKIRVKYWVFEAGEGYLGMTQSTLDGDTISASDLREIVDGMVIG